MPKKKETVFHSFYLILPLIGLLTVQPVLLTMAVLFLRIWIIFHGSRLYAPGIPKHRVAPQT